LVQSSGFSLRRCERTVQWPLSTQSGDSCGCRKPAQPALGCG